MRRVIVISPFRGATPEEEARNRRYLARAMRDCLVERDEAPFASHGLYTLPGVLNDGDPEERRLGMDAGRVWMGVEGVSARVYHDHGISEGMRADITAASEYGLSVYFHTIGAEP